MYKVSKVSDFGSVETLPDISDTSIWVDLDVTKPSREVRLVAWLYMAVQKRENYYQENTPCAFGDPKYEYYSGLVHGILQAGEVSEEVKEEYIDFRRGGRVVLRVDRVQKPEYYYETNKENKDLLKGLLG